MRVVSLAPRPLPKAGGITAMSERGFMLKRTCKELNRQLGRERTHSHSIRIFAIRSAAVALLGAANAFAGPIEDLLPGQWYEVPGSSMKTVNPCPSELCSYSGVEGQTGVMDDWNGGAFATKFGTKGGLIVWGGGHKGYLGNEIYVFDVGTLKWVRVTDPVVNPSCDLNEAELQDGSPCSPHNYDYLSYHPGSNSFVKLGSASDHMQGGGGSPRVHMFSFDTKQWRRGTRKPTFKTSEGASSAYDPNRDVFWLLSAYNVDFAKFDPNANGGAGQWTEYQQYNIEIGAVAAIDPVHDLFVTVEGTYNHEVHVFDLKNPSSPGVKISTAGDKTIENTQAPGFEWDPSTQAFIAWAGGTAVYKLTPPSGDWKTATWQWSKLPAASTNVANPGSPNSRGTYGRWRYVPSINGFIVVNRNTDNVFIYKLSDAPPIVEPNVTFTADSFVLDLGLTTTLHWNTSNATSCTASNGWSGVKATSGTQVIGPIAVATTYTLTCTNNSGGTTTRSVVIGLVGPAPDVSLSASPASVAPGASANLTWSSQNATSCTASQGDGSWTGAKATNGSATVGPINSATTYAISCVGSDGVTTASATATVTLNTSTPGAPTVTLNANKTAIAANSPVTLTWSTTNATSCTASGAWSGAKSTGGSQSTGPISATATYTLTCTNASGASANASRTINVVATPIVTLTANPTTVSAGGSSILTWSSTNATSCVASSGDPSWAGAKGLTGSGNVGPINASTVYRLICTGAGGTTTVATNVGVGTAAGPTISMSAAPAQLQSGESTTITWNVVNATTCAATGAWFGSKATTGSQQFTNLTANQTYSLTCSNATGSSSQDLTVQVSGAPQTALASGGESKGGGALGFLSILGLGFIALLRALWKSFSWRALPLVFAATAASAADLTTVTVVSESSGAQTNVPVTFGQVFKPGDVPNGSTVTGAIGASAIPTQVDIKARHADGSARHAIVTVQVPTLAANGSSSVILRTAAPSGSGSVTLAQLLASSFDAQISLNVGGTVYSASAKTLLQSGTPTAWLTGPLVSEWIVSGPVKTSGGTAHAHLTAYFHVRAYSDGSGGVGRVRVDCVVENGWTLVAGAGTFTYSPSITVGGTQVYTTASLTHYHHTRWHKQFWWPNAPQAYTRLDTTYLRATKAVPNFGSTVIEDSYLATLKQTAIPMDRGDLTEYMPDPGAQISIGPLPRWDAVYLTSSADVRALRNVLTNHDSAGSYPTHFRDEATGRPVSIADRPTLSLQVPSDFPSTTGPTTTNFPEVAHEPSLGYLAYVITGDYYYLEETQFWTSWNQLWLNADYRQGNKGLVYSEIRAQAWLLRSLGQAAYITPDTHPYKAHLKASIDNNMAAYDAQYTNNPNANALGAIQYYADNTINAMWQDDFLTWMLSYLTDLGFTSAAPFRDWKFKFVVGRNNNVGYCYQDAALYTQMVGPSATTFYPTFQAMHDANVAAGKYTAKSSCPDGAPLLTAGYPGNPDGYFSNMTPALAAAVEYGYAGASAAWARFKSGTPQADYKNYPNWNVVPRSDPQSTAPSVGLSAAPAFISSGQGTTLSWTSTNSSSCTASGGWSGTKSTSGSESISNITTTTSYTLTCTGSGGPPAAQTVIVAIGTGTTPVASLNASSSTVTAGSPVTLSWSSTNAASCTAGGGWSGTKAVSGSETIASLSATTAFTLVCTGTGGTSPMQSVTVTVGSSPTPTPTPTPTPPSSPASVGGSGGGGALSLDWIVVLAIGLGLQRARRRYAVR